MKRWYEGLGIGDHAAHIYRSDVEQVRVVMDTISWTNEDQRVVLLSDRWDAEARAPRPRVLDAAIEDGHLLVVPARSTLCPSGRFNAKAIETLVRAEAESAADDGRSDPVIMWDLDWLAADEQAFEAHVVQQSGMSLSPSTHQVTMIGQYGTSFYSPEQQERLLRVNPLVLEGGLLTRKFWVVAKSSVGKSSKGGHTLRVSASAERAKIDEL
jgi:hypothetical protein